MSHSLIWLSADPDTKSLVWAVQMANTGGADMFSLIRGGKCILSLVKPLTRTVAGDRPDGSVVTVVRSQPLSVGREPGVDDMVLGCSE